MLVMATWTMPTWLRSPRRSHRIKSTETVEPVQIALRRLHLHRMHRRSRRHCPLSRCHACLSHAGGLRRCDRAANSFSGQWLTLRTPTVILGSCTTAVRLSVWRWAMDAGSSPYRPSTVTALSTPTYVRLRAARYDQRIYRDASHVYLGEPQPLEARSAARDAPPQAHRYSLHQDYTRVYLSHTHKCERV